MLPNARYPIIVQPKAVGVDRQGHMIENNTYDNHPEIVNESDCFWVKHNEGEPVFEVALSYVPQSNMSCKYELSLFFFVHNDRKTYICCSYRAAQCRLFYLSNEASIGR